MSRLPDDFHQDRALRDAALGVLKADIEHARATLNGKAIAGRVTGRIGDGAKDVLEIAKTNASDRQGLLAGLIALLALWFAREPLAEILGFASEAFEDTADANTTLDEDHGVTDTSELDAEGHEIETPDAANPPVDDNTEPLSATDAA
ncbi:MAG: hypothetical protein HRT64_06285 [Erythrobacter sp.]|nr:hypothetical protein [Erythrobacter sp.]